MKIMKQEFYKDQQLVESKTPIVASKPPLFLKNKIHSDKSDLIDRSNYYTPLINSRFSYKEL